MALSRWAIRWVRPAMLLGTVLDELERTQGRYGLITLPTYREVRSGCPRCFSEYCLERAASRAPSD